MTDLIQKDDEILRYLRESDIIKKHTNIKNIAIDIDNYINNSKNFRKLENIKPIEEINKFLDKNSTNDNENIRKITKNLTIRTNYNYNNTSSGIKNDSSGIKINRSSKSLANVFDFNDNKSNKKSFYSPSPMNNFQVIFEETKSDFLMTGLKFSNGQDIKEQNQSKYLPPLTNKSSFFINKDIKIIENKKTDENFDELNKGIFLLIFRK